MLDLLRHTFRLSALPWVAIMVGVIGLAACGGNGDVPAAQNTAEASAESATSAPASAPTEAATESSTETATDTDIPAADPSLEQITIGLSMYLLVDDLDNPDPAVSSARTEDDLVAILERMNDVWGQAGVRFELATLDTLVVEPDVLKELAAGNIRALFYRLGESIPFTESGMMSGFYTKDIGGPNGITPQGFRWFVVIDEPSVFDHRVSSHEVGHILGLRDDLDDPDQLLYSGTNGMKLNSVEIGLARFVANRFLAALRASEK